MENLVDSNALERSPPADIISVSKENRVSGIEDVSEAAASYVRSAFVPCDVTLASCATCESTLPRHSAFRGAPILKPSLASKTAAGTVTIIRSRVFPGSVSHVRFFSAAATFDLEEAVKQKCCEVAENAATTRLVCRHERLFQHPVSSGCILQSGMQMQVNNKKPTLARARSNNSVVEPWQLYFGARWKDEDIFAAELAKARSTSARPVRVLGFPGSHLITRKDNLAMRMQKMRLQFPNDFDFTPASFVLPRDNALFLAELSRLKSNNNNNATADAAIFIGKPPASSQGRGVFLFRADSIPAQVTALTSAAAPPTPATVSMTQTSSSKAAAKKMKPGRHASSSNDKSVPSTDAAQALPSASDDDEQQDDEQPDDETADALLLVQRYIDKPLTIHGFKVDLRIYVLVTSFDPLKIFVFNDGLVRFATVPLRKPTQPHQQQHQGGGSDPAPLSELCAHLTNVSVNSKAGAAAYTKTDSAEQDGTAEGSKWTLHALKRHVVAKFDAATWDRCWAGLCMTVTKTFLTIQDDVTSRVNSIVQNRNSCFELFGFDVLLDETLRKSFVLEVNYLPSLVCSSALDRHIKGHMIADMLSLVGVSASQTSCVGSRDAAAAAMVEGPILSSAAMRRKGGASALMCDADFQQRLDSIVAAAAASGSNTTNHNSGGSSKKQKDAPPSSVASLRKRFFETVTDDADRGIVSYAEDELARRGGWERVFPTAASVRDLRHLFTTSARRGNRILWAFEALKSMGAFPPTNEGGSTDELLVWMRMSPAAGAAVPAPPPAPPPAATVTAKKIIPPPPPPAPTPVKRKSVAAPSSRRVGSVPAPSAAARSVRKRDEAPAAAAVAGAAPLSCQLFSFQPIPSAKK